VWQNSDTRIYSISVPSLRVTLTHNPNTRIDMAEDNAGSSSAVIVGIVAIVAILILIYFLFMRTPTNGEIDVNIQSPTEQVE
jgi:heme/copper-type cytochrome/quinol oxidase subunit 4